MKSKKILLGSLSTMALVATPIATVVSCGGTKDVSSPMKYLEMKDDYKESITKSLKAKDMETKDSALERIHRFARILYDGEIETVFSNKKKLTDKDVKAITDAKDPATAYNEFQKLWDKGIYQHFKTNSVITLNKKEIDLGEFVSQEDFDKWAKEPEVAEAGSPATSGTAPATPYAESAKIPQQGADAQKTTTPTTKKPEVNTILTFKKHKIDLGKFVAKDQWVNEVNKLLNFKVGNKEEKMVRWPKGFLYKQIKDFATRADAIIGFIKANAKADDKGTDFTDADFKAIKEGKDKAAQDNAIDEFMKKKLFQPEYGGM